MNLDKSWSKKTKNTMASNGDADVLRLLLREEEGAGLGANENKILISERSVKTKRKPF
jgi:hypothetical protein